MTATHTLMLELLDDVAITASSATIDAHETLTYIPGQCLLGAMARDGRYEAHEAAGEAWDLFHSGAVRFGCALPLIDGAPAWPIPMSLHQPKGVEPTDDDGRLVNDVVNLAVEGPRADGPRLMPVRDLHLNRHGQTGSPRRMRTMRTAIGAEGRARDGFLFTMSALARGQRFVAEITADDARMLEPVRRVFEEGFTFRVGRSRGAEFGAVKVTASAPADVRPAAGDHRPTGSVLVWCLSDVCLRDATTGQPTFSPSSEQFGLPDTWTFAAARSYLRTRVYSPFNAHRKRPDIERQVIVAGSVLRFEAPEGSPLSPDEWARAIDHTSRGVGEHRAEGLGCVVFDPVLLRTAKLVFAETAHAIEERDEVDAAAPDDPLLRWIERQHGERLARDDAWSRAHALLGELWLRPRWTLPASQWGEVRRLARVNRGLDAQRLGATLDAFVRATGPQRGVRALHDRWGVKHQGESLAQWVVKAVSAIDAAPPVPGITLEFLGVHAVRQQRAAKGRSR